MKATGLFSPRRRGISSAVILVIFSLVQTWRGVAAPPVITTAAGTADVTTAIAAFKTAIGGVDNGGAPPPKATGFRTINWDGVKLDGTDFGGNTTVIDLNKTIGIPINRFQARGVVFAEVYAVSGDGFTSVNPNAATLFPAFSPLNTFAMFNEKTIDFHFVLASDPAAKPVPAASRGFGVVFLNVNIANKTSVEFMSGSKSLLKVFAPVAAGKLPSFVGALFDSPVVTDVSISCGTDVLFKFKNGVFTAVGKDDTAHKHNIVVTDDFIFAEPVPGTNSFSAVIGNYAGLISPGDVHANTGIANVKLDKKGVLTGKVTLGGVTKPLHATFMPDGTLAQDIAFGPTPADIGTLALAIDYVNGTDKLTGSVTKNATMLPVALDRNVFSTKNPFAGAGKYTVVIAGSGIGTQPHGACFGSVKITKAGVLTVAGKLSDGTSFGQSVGLSKAGNWPFYVPLYDGGGSVGGNQVASPGTFVGSARWIRPSSSSPIFGGGFDASLPLEADAYNTAAAVTGFTVASVDKAPPDLAANFTHAITVTATGKVTVTMPGADQISLSLSPGTGAFSGSFLDDNSVKRKFSGVILQGATTFATGFYLGTAQSGAVAAH